MANGKHDFASRIGYPILVASMLAVAAFTASRAGHDDLDRVEKRGEERETRILSEIEKLEVGQAALVEKFHAAEVTQAEFRSAVRAALRIPDDE